MTTEHAPSKMTPATTEEFETQGAPSMDDLLANIEFTPLETIQYWPDLFHLCRFPDGRYWAMLDGKLEKQFQALEEAIKPKTLYLEEAFFLLSRISVDDLKAVLKVVQEAEKHPNTKTDKDTLPIDVPERLRDSLTDLIESAIYLLDAIGSDLHQMRYVTDRMTNAKAAKSLIASFEKGINAWRNRYIRKNKRSRSPKLYSHKFGHQGKTITNNLPYFAILFATRWVEDRQELPKKAQLRASLVSAFPALVERNDTFWTRLYTDAGLSDLDKAEPWAAEKEVQHKTLK